MRRFIEQGTYARDLGMEIGELGEETARLHLPFAEPLTNGDQVMHGGCAASLAAAGAHVVTRATLGEASGPWHTVSLQVNYLAAAKSQGVFADARLLRRGKELCFVEVDVTGDDGRAIAHATTTVRGRFGAEPASLQVSASDPGESDPGKMGPHLGRIPFIGGRNISVEHMTGGTSRLAMPWQERNADLAGGVHEGAVLSLLDTAGAMASWAVTGFGPYKAGTPSMQAQILAPPPKDDLVAYGRNVQRDGAIFFSDAEVAGASDGRVCARGTVFSRIVT
ncbi:MAG: PaaI family thioesterase [Myxococcota bacterium]